MRVTRPIRSLPMDSGFGGGGRPPDIRSGVRRVVAAAGLVLAAASPIAQAAVDVPAERSRIRTERAEAQRRYQDRARECRTQFAVNRCLDAARAERSDVLERLRHEELLIDDTERRERAAARLERIRAKQEKAAAEPPAASAPVVVREREAAASRPAAAPRAPKAPRARPASDAAREAAQRADFEARQRAAAAHRAEVERRNAERAKRGKPAAPLPTPTPDASGQ